MLIKQLYTNCLAEAAYYIESNGKAAIIDPLRETEPYVKLAQERGVKIEYIFETHFHADFVSGHLDLAKETNAKIVYGPTAKPNFEAYIAEDEEIFQIGDVQLKVLHTPGHTMESTTFLLIDADGKDHAIFTGDTLFIGDVGRPDLAVKTNLSREDLAGHLFDSLQKKILPLADELIVYPGHGAGSACGKNLSTETVDTLGNQKKNNYALRTDMTRDEFIKEITHGLLPPPQYFPKNAVLNKMGYESINDVMGRGKVALTSEEFQQKMQTKEVVILDTREPEEFGQNFIPGAINIGLSGMFAVWVGTLIQELNTPILIVAPKGQEEETVLRLARVGYDNSLGYLEGGMNAWTGNKTNIQNITAQELAKQATANQLNLLDVRNPKEFASEHLLSAQNFPLDYINNEISNLDKNQTYYLHCKGGYRSMVAASVLRAKGYQKLVNVEGGFDAIRDTNLERSEYVCPSTL